jgi:hypothetical protein
MIVIMSYRKFIYQFVLNNNTHRQRLATLNLKVLLGELDTLLNVTLKVLEASIEETLLVLGDGANGVNLLNTVGAKLDLRGKEVDTLVLVERRVDEGGLNDTLLALRSLEERLGETGTGHGHRESGRASTALCLDHLITTELDALDVVGELLALEVVARLGEERDNGSTRVTTNDNNVLRGGVGVLDLRDEARGTDDIKSGDTEHALGVVYTGSLEDLGSNGHGRVDGVGNDQDVSLGAVLSSGLGQVADDRGVGVEEICGLAGQTVFPRPF